MPRRLLYRLQNIDRTPGHMASTSGLVYEGHWLIGAADNIDGHPRARPYHDVYLIYTSPSPPQHHVLLSWAPSVSQAGSISTSLRADAPQDALQLNCTSLYHGALHVSMSVGYASGSETTSTVVDRAVLTGANKFAAGVIAVTVTWEMLPPRG
ncbi:hypothetical protein OH76DRAFT_369042 [Lentinus brumalis]|uniref:Uncharacterized protein n=1 Tax=Lentinus brumalis TaxID=2498619 RepID=A0A371DED7_9APHY|nr:hypothetical protein OH76DRAFT_369042 [Polyporus brumalis]